MTKRFVSHIKARSPISQAHGFTLVGNPSVIPGVSGLFIWSGPSAILWGVITIIVDAFNRVFRSGFRTHIVHKQTKVVPAFADLYASRAIFVVSGIVRLLATVDHCRPRFVFRCISKTVFCTYSLTPTRCAVAVPEATGRNDALIPAITDTVPNNDPVLLTNRIESNKITESCPGDILCVNRKGYSCVSHFDGPVDSLSAKYTISTGGVK